jgi:putative copper export protein
VFGLFDSAYAVAVGCVLARIWLVSPALRGEQGASIRRSLRSAAPSAAAALSVLLLAQAYLLTASMAGSAAFSVVRDQVRDVLTSTHAGRVLIPQAAILLILLLLGGRDTTARRRWLELLLLVTLTAVRAASGHAATEGDFSRLEALQFLHLASIGVWAGGIIAAGFLLLPHLLGTAPNAFTSIARRLSSASTYAVIVVLLTGVVKAWLGLGESLHPLLSTQWGLLLSAKSVLVLLAVLLGLANRLHLRRNDLLAEPDASRFARRLRLEAVLMIAILQISAFLANSPPAADALNATPAHSFQNS